MIKIILHFYFTFNFNINFDEILSYIQIIINNFLNNIINLRLNKIYYDFKVKDFINLLFVEDLFKKKINKFQLILKKEIDNVMIFIFIITKI